MMTTDASHETIDRAIQDYNPSATQFHFASGQQCRLANEKVGPSSDRPNAVQLTGHADRKMSFHAIDEAIEDQVQPTTFVGADHRANGFPRFYQAALRWSLKFGFRDASQPYNEAQAHHC